MVENIAIPYNESVDLFESLLIFGSVFLLFSLIFVWGTLEDRKKQINDLYRAIAWAESKKTFIESLKPTGYMPTYIRTLPGEKRSPYIPSKNYEVLQHASRIGSSPLFRNKDNEKF